MGRSIISLSKAACGAVLAVSVFFEMLLYPSWENLIGCFLAAFCYLVFFLLINNADVVLNPFSTICFVNFFLYRFLPLPATLLEGKPVSYMMGNPHTTFALEAAQFFVCSAAYSLACYIKRANRGVLPQLYKSWGIFDVPPTSVFWGIGWVGLILNAYVLFSGIEAGIKGSAGNVVRMFLFVVNAPTLLLFPGLIGCAWKVNAKPVAYFIGAQLLLGAASNSRNALLAPVFVLAILWVLDAVKSGKDVTVYIRPLRLATYAAVAYIAASFMTDMSAAMLQTRAIRDSVDKVTLFKETVGVFFDRELLRAIKNAEAAKDGVYKSGWSERYLDNFALNRFANIKISDLTLGYAMMLDEDGADAMRQDLFSRVLFQVPPPFSKFLGIDKSGIYYSRGDALVATANKTPVFAGFRVTSYLGDGYATFGYWFFLLEFFVLVVFFGVLNSLVWRDRTMVVYSPLGLMYSYWYFVNASNGQGIYSVVSLCVRGFWINLLVYAIMLRFVRLFIK